ncbi:hypothetical protein [Brevibacillus reuszeri]|uniref:hypothetical protein n=1 Tax=Brevibacillus reuszeri TaxID=54915 RepID=UPI001F2ABCD1|nr:hypothetical protein [Brevibacillus reuszeri]
MDKSFYYLVPWSDVSYLKDALLAMEILFVIEQKNERLSLEEGSVANVFPDMHVRVYGSVSELFGVTDAFILMKQVNCYGLIVTNYSAPGFCLFTRSSRYLDASAPYLPLRSTPISTDQTSFLFFLHCQFIHMTC